jgi:Domain of unknown function (DUF4124)
MMATMPGRIVLLLAIALPIAAAEADTVYKYRRPDGRTIYSNKPEPGLELIETFEYKFADPPPARPGAAQDAAEGEARIEKRLDDLQTAWTEVQESRAALAQAEERLRAGSVEQEGDRIGIVTGAAPPAVGGVPRTGRPATGGTMRGAVRSRPSPEYVARVESLEAGLAAARARLDAALRRYNELR